MENASNAYWCSLCSKVHVKVEGSDEYVMKTGWTSVKDGTVHASGEKINVGFCNGVHSEGRPVRMHPASVMPAFVAKEEEKELPDTTGSR